MVSFTDYAVDRASENVLNNIYEFICKVYNVPEIIDVDAARHFNYSSTLHGFRH